MSLLGKKIYGFCNGYFGRDDYNDKIIILEGEKWIVCAYLDRDIDYVTCANFNSEEEKVRFVGWWNKDSE